MERKRKDESRTVMGCIFNNPGLFKDLPLEDRWYISNYSERAMWLLRQTINFHEIVGKISQRHPKWLKKETRKIIRNNLKINDMLAGLANEFRDIKNWTKDDKDWFCSNTQRAIKLFVATMRNQKFMEEFFKHIGQITIPDLPAGEIRQEEFVSRHPARENHAFSLEKGRPTEKMTFLRVTVSDLFAFEKDPLEILRQSIMTLDQMEWLAVNVIEKNRHEEKNYVFAALDMAGTYQAFSSVKFERYTVINSFILLEELDGKNTFYDPFILIRA